MLQGAPIGMNLAPFFIRECTRMHTNAVKGGAPMRVEKDIVVNAPVERVYQLWTDFENFPQFMTHVEEVRRTGERTLHWRAKLGPRLVEWDAEIRAMVPNRTVTWHSTSGADNAGAVTLAEKGE